MAITKDDIDFYISGYPTGYVWIDYLTDVPGVFFPEGAVTEVMGQKSTAKTTLIFEAIANYHRGGGTKKTLYLDFERTVKKQASYLSNLGVDIANESLFRYEQPETFQEGGDLILKLLRGKLKGETQQDYAFIVVDTVAAMRPEQEVSNSLGETKQQGLRAKLMSELLRNLTSDLASDGPAVIFVNQVYEQININKGPAAAFLPATFDSTASSALKYYASFRVSLTLKGKLKTKIVNPFTFEEEEQFVGSIIEAMAEKSKIGVPFRKARFVVKYGYGVDPLPTLISAAIKKPNGDLPIIKVEGNKSIFSYLINPETGEYSQRFKGLTSLQSYLSENYEEAVSIANKISPEWGQCLSSFNKSSLTPLQEEGEDGPEDL